MASPPYDVVSRNDAARLAEGNPHSFLHVVRSDIDLPPETDPHDDRVYRTAKANLDRLMRDGVLQRDPADTVYLYELSVEGRSQIGVVGCVHVDDYEHGVIRRHELTRKDKEDDRTRHILTLDAHAETVIMAVRDTPTLASLTRASVQSEPICAFTDPDGVRHRVWRVAEPGTFIQALDAIPHAYVADGHHRCAGAWRAALERRNVNPSHQSNEEYDWFPAALFPASQLHILPYHRVVRNMSGLTPEGFLEQIRSTGQLIPCSDPAAIPPGSVGAYLDGHWQLLTFNQTSIPYDDPVRSLDAALLDEQVLQPILGIRDIRADNRIDFVGGIRGTAELERRVDGGEMAVAFALHPVTVEQLLAVSDAGAIMPPKTTWFEPKLRSGLFVHTLS